MDKKLTFLLTSMAAIAFMAGCTTPTMEYRHVYLAATATVFHYVDPGEATVQLMEKDLDTLETFSVYLYEPVEGVTFDSTQFFTYLGDHVLYRHQDTLELYTREKSDIPGKITQYYIDKQAFESGQ